MAKITDRSGRPTSGQMPSIVEAIVVDNRDPDRLGRVKVELVTLAGKPKSDWARLVTPMAGKNRGWVTIPEVGDEVLVSFVHGDFHTAVVIGSLYNGVDVPPYANEDGENNLRVFQSRSGHRLTFDDTVGAERVELVLHGENVRVVWDAANKTLGVFAGKDIVVESNETIRLECNDFVLEAEDVRLRAGGDVQITARHDVRVQASGKLTIAGAPVKLN